MSQKKYLHSHFLLFNTLVIVTAFQQPECRNSDYDQCIEMADPLIREPRLIFPDNLQDIDYVCRKWNNFVDCIKRYTDRCFTEKQRRQFNKAVENPIESVYQMCSQPEYQKEYLHYAPCMKNTVTERAFCAPHYALLMEHVSQGNEISISVLCCSYNRFRDCVLRETRRLCDRGIPDGPATRYATHIIDKALSFLQEQCSNHIPNAGDCGVPTGGVHSPSDFSGTTPSTVESRWNTFDEELSSSKSLLTSVLTPPRSSAAPSWMDSSDPMDPNIPSVSVLGSRSRPSSYGRSKSWSNSASPNVHTNSNTNPSANTAQAFSDSPVPRSSPSSPWATVSPWREMNPTRDDGTPFGSSQMSNSDSPSDQGSSPKKTDDELSTTNSEDGGDYSSSNEPSSAQTPDVSNSYHYKDFSDNGRTPVVVENSPALFGQSPGTVSETSRDISFLTEATTSTSTETWYPAAGNQLSNEVDEPNQQGWSKPDNKGETRGAYLSLTLLATALTTTFC
ncbi:cell wall protein RBR3 isoform X2 [Agrilus planipennis]|nr:cell wall protein RBR3 isoform X2 [Agrilus planipennis]XP_018330880.1 cell wall protein RBR3 isoform X2 [Agrilus planipennis]